MGMLDDLKLLDDALEKELGSTENLPALEALRVKMLGKKGQLTALRHIELANRAADALKRAVGAIDTGLPLDTAAIDIGEALECLSGITGENATEEVIDRVFRDFCVGK